MAVAKKKVVPVRKKTTKKKPVSTQKKTVKKKTVTTRRNFHKGPKFWLMAIIEGKPEVIKIFHTVEAALWHYPEYKKYADFHYGEDCKCKIVKSISEKAAIANFQKAKNYLHKSGSKTGCSISWK